MSKESFDLLVNLMDGVISENNILDCKKITNSQYNSIYLKIFLDETDRNHGKPIPYDAFGDKLWTKLNKDANAFAKQSEEFIDVWNGWVYLYRYLKENNKLK